MLGKEIEDLRPDGRFPAAVEEDVDEDPAG